MLKHNLRIAKGTLVEKRSSIDVAWVAVGAVVLLAVGGAAALLSWSGLFGGLSEVFRYDLTKLKKTDTALIKYRETAAIPVGLKEARAVAVGPDDRVYVAGDNAIEVFDPSGAKRAQLALGDQPRCLAVAGPQHASPGRIYVGMKGRVEVCDAAGKRLAAWEDLGARALLTSIAAGDADVYVADAGNRLVYRYDPSGKRLATIGKRDRTKETPVFVIPSPYFDLALTGEGQLRVVNPGRHRIEWYTPAGVFEGAWGEPGEEIDRFCGCCNPANFAILPDGRIVTAEKGIPRVKVYQSDGTFFGVVAGTETLAPGATVLEETRDEHRLGVLDVAADSRGRILVLDPAAAKVRVFEPKPAGKAAAEKGT
jgi:sugar lactone lactonase YvrE